VAPESVERKLAAILSADAAGYSRLMAEDEDETVRRVANCREQAALLVPYHHHVRMWETSA
jgi:class 3 adenylate cyclase